MEDKKKLVGSIAPVNIEGTKKILAQLMNCIFKIKIKGAYATGFFCKIPYKKQAIKVFMTSYHFFNENVMKENQKINLSLNDEKETKSIDLSIERITYFNKDYDITLIELKDEDKIKDYLELDDNLFQDNSELFYKNKSIYTLLYQNGENACVSYGLLHNIDKYNIMHNCSIDNNSSGCPILNLQSNKVIGIHNKNSINYNIGNLLKLPIKDFINQNLNKKNSIIINDIEYKIIKELGKGGFGKVYQVLNESDNKNYAIKEISIKDETEDKIKAFQNEAIILSKFNCDNIIKYYDSSKDENNIYILMEFCQGENLRNFIDRHMEDNTLIKEDLLKNIIKQICKGLKEIHNMKIVHRDLKPENIFMNENMNIKIWRFWYIKTIKFISDT